MPDNENGQIDRLEKLIEKGEKVLETHEPNPPGVIGFPTLDSGSFSGWRAQSLNFLGDLVGPDHVYYEQFDSEVARGYRSSARKGVEILEAVREDAIQGDLDQAEEIDESTNTLERLFDRFHLVVRQLRSRHEDRETLSVSDEYDVQDLLHALLWIDFEDVRAEEHTPSYAGKSSRMDFLLKDEGVVVEVKKTRPTMDAKELSTQLIEDIDRYKSHPDLNRMVCFVYDPEGYIANPRGVEADLTRSKPFPVDVYIRPD